MRLWVKKKLIKPSLAISLCDTNPSHVVLIPVTVALAGMHRFNQTHGASGSSVAAALLLRMHTNALKHGSVCNRGTELCLTSSDCLTDH